MSHHSFEWEDGCTSMGRNPQGMEKQDFLSWTIPFVENYHQPQMATNNNQAHPKDFKASLKEIHFMMNKVVIQAAPNPISS